MTEEACRQPGAVTRTAQAGQWELQVKVPAGTRAAAMEDVELGAALAAAIDTAKKKEVVQSLCEQVVPQRQQVFFGSPAAAQVTNFGMNQTMVG